MAKKAKDETGPKEERGTDMPYERHVVPVPEDDPSGAKALYIESRGIRRSITPIMGDQADQFVAYMRSPDLPANRFEELKEFATAILLQGRVPLLKEVLKKARTDQPLSERDEDTVASAWWERVRAIEGTVTPKGIAANFLYWAYRLDRLQNKPVGEMKVITLYFADAWHWLHMEASGEHKDAFSGVKRKQDLAKSGPARSGRKALSETILEEVYLERRTGTKNPEAFKKASSAAPLILADVNARLKGRGLDEYTEKTLTKKLGPIMKRVRAER